VDNFLNVSAAFGRFLYMCARARKAKRIVEFGISLSSSCWGALTIGDNALEQRDSLTMYATHRMIALTTIRGNVWLYLERGTLASSGPNCLETPFKHVGPSV
jgi:hypothetical protein